MYEWLSHTGTGNFINEKSRLQDRSLSRGFSCVSLANIFFSYSLAQRSCQKILIYIELSAWNSKRGKSYVKVETRDKIMIALP